MARLSPIPTQIVDAFRAVAPAIEAFARQHDLLIDRYRRGKPSWELRFARRIGGEAVLTISYRERTGHVLDVSVTWWLDDRATRTRRLRSDKIGVYDRRAPSAVLVQHRFGSTAWALSGCYISRPRRGKGGEIVTPMSDSDDRAAEHELRLAFGRAIGFTLAALLLLLGGGILLILIAAAFLRFAFGG